MIDGLLTDEVGRGPQARRLDLLVDPNRESEWARCPPLDAYVVTHEHEDHFHIPSLSLLDRRIRLYVSARISVAARSLLDEMGFDVVYVFPRDVVSMGGLEIEFFSANHMSHHQGDEWDTLAYMVRVPEYKVSFFSNVDIALTHQISAIVDRHAADGYRILTYSDMELLMWEGLRGKGSKAPSHRIRGGYAENRLAAESLLENGQSFPPLPGQSFSVGLSGVSCAESSPFLRVSPESNRAPRPFAKGVDDEIVPPIREMAYPSPAIIEELNGYLQELAEYIYGRNLYRRLYSIGSREEIGGLHPSFVLILLVDERTRLTYEYVPEGCCFTGS
jgi:hypothetical protein